MTKEEKKFKIKKLKKYEKELSNENKKSIENSVFMGISALAAAFCFSDLARENIEEARSAFEMIFGLSNVGFVIYRLKGMLEAISNKVALKYKIEDINNELEFAEQEEKRGMKR